MLVLSRREGESVCVGDGVVVTVVRICGNRVRVGVDAEDQPILRLELKEKTTDEGGNEEKNKRKPTSQTTKERGAA